MTINELHIQLDLQPENKINVLENIAKRCDEGYLFVDLNDGHCYLFDEDGNEDDVKKLKKIKTNMFYDSNIESIVIPDSVENIRGYAFACCRSLKSIEIPDSVNRIGNDIFWKCESLKSVIIPDSVESIGNSTFYRCKSLESIVIPDSVKWIGYRAFEYCENLKSLIFKGKTIDQVKAMENYPFGIKDESIIRCI